MSTENRDPLEIPESNGLVEEAERLNQLDEPPAPPPRKGFLPIDTNLFDRWFIGIVCLVAIHLLWMRFVESILPIGFATLISVILGYAIIRWG